MESGDKLWKHLAEIHLVSDKERLGDLLLTVYWDATVAEDWFVEQYIAYFPCLNNTRKSSSELNSASISKMQIQISLLKVELKAENTKIIPSGGAKVKLL